MKKTVQTKKKDKRQKLETIVNQELSQELEKTKKDKETMKNKVTKVNFGIKSSRDSLIATIKKEFKSDIEGIEACEVCKGEGYITDEKGIKHQCSACGGVGITYTPPKKMVIGRSTGEIVKSKKAEPVDFIKTETVQKEIKFKALQYNKKLYLISKDLLIRDTFVTDITPDGEIENCLDKILKNYFKALGVDSISKILANKKSVQGVRYKVEQECKKITLSGKLQDTTEYVKSGLKLSNQTWIDSKYLEVFKGCRFIYLNPIGKEIANPVLVVDKSNSRLEGIIMPLIR